MIVYIVTEEWPIYDKWEDPLYEKSVIKVFSNEDAAKEFAASKNVDLYKYRGVIKTRPRRYGWVEVEEWTVD